MTEALRSHVRALRAESGEKFDAALDTCKTLLQNVLEQPDEAKFRTIRLGNAAFHQRLGQFPSGIALLRSLGFEDANAADGSPGGDGLPAYLALPVADAALLAQGLVLVAASREASLLVASERGGGPPPAAAAAAPSAAAAASAAPREPRRVEAVRSNAAGKRRAESDTGGGGKRPAGGSADGEGAARPDGGGATASAAELESYRASAIDEYFLAACGATQLTVASPSRIVRLPASELRRRRLPRCA